MRNPWIKTLPRQRLDKVVTVQGEAMMRRYGTDDVYFALWMHALNRVVQQQVGVAFDDLEDWGYWDMYEAGSSPREAAIEMLVDNGWEEALP